MRALVVESAEVVGLFNKNIPNTGIIAELSSGPKQPAASVQTYSGAARQGTAQTPAVATTESDGRDSYGGSQYKLFDVGMTWTDAKAYCEGQGGYLVTITSAEEQKFIENLIARGSKNFYWLGGDCGSDRRFRWVTSEPMVFTNWGPGEPNNDHGGSEDKIFISRVEFSHASGFRNKWNDTRNNPGADGFWGISSHGLICEWSQR
jgi:hypothetical protein